LVAAIFAFMLIYAASLSIGKGVKSMTTPPVIREIDRERYRQGDMRARVIITVTGVFLAIFWIGHTFFGVH
jgi:hypothetical protein